ncbi:MAG: spermidine synthase [Phenylobacterium sp.]|jgi:spermidine synthase
MTTKKNPVYLIPSVFFLSGFSALIFETLWFRTASVVLGSSIYSAAAVLMAFMAGLGIGNILMALRGDSVTQPLKTYIVIEVIIGLSGVFAIWFLPVISPLMAKGLSHFTSHEGLLNLSRFITAFLVLLLPSTAMGMTIPVLQKFLHHHNQHFSRSLGILYGFNTLGAVSGALVAEFGLIAVFGISGSGWVACVINLLLVLMVLRAFSLDQQAALIEKSGGGIGQLLALKTALIPPFLAGFILLALEVVWFRYMLLTRSGTSAIFALMLAIVLVGIGVGGLISSRIPLNKNRLQWLTLWLPLLGAVTVSLSFFAFDKIFTTYFGQLDADLTVFIGAAMVLMLPSCIISGMMYPLFGEVLYQRLEHTTGATGMLTFTNTMGAALGSGVATFILLPELGVENAILLLSLTYIVAAGFVYRNHCGDKPVAKPLLKVYLPVLSATALLLVCFPFGALQGAYQTFAKVMLPNEKLLKVKEGLNETLQYYQAERFGQPLYFRLVTNNFSMSGNDFAGQRYMKLYAYFAYIFNRDIKDVLQISYGVGSTAEAISRLNSLQHFDVVDISEDILQLSSIIHSATGIFPLKDKRTKVHLEDGRFFLQTTPRQYDLITGEPPPPKNAGIVNLYTQEYFQLIHQRLKPKGMVTYWLPVHDLHDTDALAIIKAFCNVFSDCSLWNGVGLEFMLVGVKDGIDPISTEQFHSAWDSEIGQPLKTIGFETPAMLGTTFMADSTLLKQITEHIDPVTDNYPQRIEPRQQGMLNYSKLYAGLLDIDRRKAAYQQSDYIARLFSPQVIDETVKSFVWENLLTGLTAPLYGDKTLYYWQQLTNVLLNSDLVALPLLLLHSSPAEQAIIDKIKAGGHDDMTALAKNSTPKTPQYRLALIKQLLVARQYQQALVHFEQHILSFKVGEAKAVYISQLFLLTRALAGEQAGKVDKNALRILSESPMLDKQYVAWFRQRFCD